MASIAWFRPRLDDGAGIAEAFSANTSKLRASGFDGLLHARILPEIAAHGSMIGACLIVYARPLPFVAPLLLTMALFLALTCLVQAAERSSRDGLFGASGVLLIGAILASGLALPLTAALVIGSYGALTAANIFFGRGGRGLGFLPLYAAILMVMLAETWAAVGMFLPLFVLAVALGARMRRPGLFFGAFAGLLIALQPVFDSDQRGIALVGIAALTLICLVIFLVRTGRDPASNTRRFLNYGLVAGGVAVILALIDPSGGQNSAITWFWPLGTIIVLSIAVRSFESEAVTPAAAWLALTLILPIWNATGDGEGFGAEAARLAATMIVAALLYLLAVRRREPFAGNVAILIMFIAVLIAGFRANPAMFWGTDTTPLGDKIMDVLLLGLTLVGMLAIYRPVPVAAGALAWWRGFIRPRQAYFIRFGYRSSVQWINDVPWIGSIIKFVPKAFGTLSYLRSDRRQPRLADLTALTGFWLLVAAGTTLLTPLMTQIHTGPLTNGAPSTGLGWLAGPMAWTIAALLLFLCGLVLHETLFHFAGLAFALVPLVTILSARKVTIDYGQIGLLLLLLGVALLTSSLIRGIAILLTRGPAILRPPTIEAKPRVRARPPAVRLWTK